MPFVPAPAPPTPRLVDVAPPGSFLRPVLGPRGSEEPSHWEPRGPSCAVCACGAGSLLAWVPFATTGLGAVDKMPGPLRRAYGHGKGGLGGGRCRGKNPAGNKRVMVSPVGDARRLFSGIIFQNRSRLCLLTGFPLRLHFLI